MELVCDTDIAVTVTLEWFALNTNALHDSVELVCDTDIAVAVTEWLAFNTNNLHDCQSGLSMIQTPP